MANFRVNLPDSIICDPGPALPQAYDWLMPISPVFEQVGRGWGEQGVGFVVGWSWGWPLGHSQAATSPPPSATNTPDLPLPNRPTTPPLTMVNPRALTLSPPRDPHIDPDSDPLHTHLLLPPNQPSEAPEPHPLQPLPQPDRQDFLSLHRQGRVYLQQQDYGAAQATLQAALVGYQPQGSVGLPQVAAVLADLAQTYGHQGQRQAQEACLKRALQCCGVLQTGGQPGEVALAVAIVTALTNLQWQQGRWGEAVVLFPLALHLHHHNGTSESEAVAVILQQWGEVDLAQGRYSKAAVRLRAALNLYRRPEVTPAPTPPPAQTHPTRPFTLMRCERLLAQAYGYQGQIKAALTLLERLLSEFPLGTAPLCEEQVAIVEAIGLLYQTQGQPTQALALYRKAILNCGPVLGEFHPLLQGLHSQITALQTLQASLTASPAAGP
ncbi:MAG: tetratricopeptide repeat protein [Prochlorothrix sp.]|nr:tetratricopeptide repeat protein [Prochlorothrix sp.]